MATSSSVVARVTSRRTKAVPPSASSRSARASTGTKIAVKVASSTSAAIRLGSWLATVKALDSAAPRMAASSTMRMKPVIRLTSVASAMPQDRDTTAASDSSARHRAGCGVRATVRGSGRSGAVSSRSPCRGRPGCRRGPVEVGPVGLAAEPVLEPSADQQRQHRRRRPA